MNEHDPTGRDAHAPGAKLDAGKPLPALVLGNFAAGLMEVVQAGTDGARKYTTNGEGVETPAPVKVAGRKDDGGKLDMTLLDDMPRALEAVVEVMQWAVTKKKPVPYERGSWLGVHADRYRAAVLRHNTASAKQESTCPKSLAARFQRDDETELLHLAHLACSAMMALENTIREIEETKD